MLKQVITEWLDSQNLKWHVSGDGYLLCQCPNPKHKDTHPSAFVSTESGFIKCMGCGYYVPPTTFIEGAPEVSDMLLTAAYRKVIDKLEEKFQETIVSPISFTLPPYGNKLLAEWRGLSTDFMDVVGIYECNIGRFANRIITPFYNVEGSLVGYTGRDTTEDNTDRKIPKYMHSTGIKPSDNIMFGKLIKDLNIDPSTLIITEGSMDALSLLNIGVAATPSLGFRSPSDNFVLDAIRLGVDSIIIAWDNDQRGLEKMMEVNPDKSLLRKWQDKLPTSLGVFNDKTKWLYNSTYKDFGDVPPVLLKAFMGIK